MLFRILQRLTPLALVFASAAALAAESVRLAPGHQRVIASPGVTRAAIGNPDVADVKAIPGADQVIVTGKKGGNTDLILWNRGGKKVTYTITVSAGGRDAQGEIGSLLGNMEGVHVRQVGGRLILDGWIFRGADVNRIAQVLALYPNVTNLTRVNPDALGFLAREIENRLKTAGFSKVRVHPAGESVFLEGTIPRKTDLARAGEIAKSVYPRVVNNLAAGVEMEPLLLIDVKLMEVKTNKLNQIGVRWPSEIPATGTAVLTPGARSFSTTIGGGSQVTLRALVETGAAKILSNPKLLCRNGTPASFLAGGEIPIRLVGERTASVQFKEYGVALEVNARTDPTRQVALDIEVKISDLDSASAVDNIPGILEHRVKTAANLRFGDTVVLGGLLESRSRKNVDKVPFLGHIPVLGELFKSRDFQQSRSEFLVFLTPLPADPKLPASSRPIRDMQKAMDRTQGEIDLSILD